jgi:hypothetical protein
MQDGVLDLYDSGVLDTATREALTEFCFQYVGQQVPRVIVRPYNDNGWGYGAGDRAFLNLFNDGDFSNLGANKIKINQPVIFEGQTMLWTCPIGLNCTTDIHYAPSLGIRLEGISSHNNQDQFKATLRLVLIDSNGNLVKRETKTLSVDTIYSYPERVYDGYNTATTANSYTPNNVYTFGDYQIVLQKKYGTNGVVVNVQNTARHYNIY